jgi:uncharacterized protein
LNVLGQIISGGFGEILVRQKAGEKLEIGGLLVAESPGGGKHLLQVYDLAYGSQVSAEARELASGMKLEGVGEETRFFEEEFRNYVLAKVKGLVEITGKPHAVKTLPRFFSMVRGVEEKDLQLLEDADKKLFLGFVRSGSRQLGKEVALDGEKVLTHHVLIPASTGRGKSNLVKVMLWSLMESDYCGVLVLDAHGEYQRALERHPKARGGLVVYSPNPRNGAITLKINKSLVKPWHFNGVTRFSEAQREALYTAFNEHGEDWLDALLEGKALDNVHEGTAAVLQRKMRLLLKESLFVNAGSNTVVDDVAEALFSGKKAVIDTSAFGGETELLVASILTNAVFSSARREKEHRPVSIVLEEAPRVLNESAGSNVFSTIAREGRKFGVGLIAITQLASLIPKEVLANLNTKIILGNEMRSEREAIIGSAAQDLSDDYKAIGALDKGEAIVSSVFTPCALPVKVPLFDDYAKAGKEVKRKAFVG